MHIKKQILRVVKHLKKLSMLMRKVTTKKPHHVHIRNKEHREGRTLAVRNVIVHNKPEAVAQWANQNGHYVELKLDMVGVSLQKQYDVAISLRRNVPYSIRQKMIVEDGPFATSASGLQSFIRENIHEDT